MNLLNAYSRTSGLRIDKMIVTTHFYPLGIDGRYIVVCTSTGAPGKNYSNYKIAIDWLKPHLHKAGYKIVQVGLKDDERIGADVDVCGRTTIPQFFGIIEGCDLLISGDTSAMHAACHFNKNIVSLFSVSDPRISGDQFGHKPNQIYLTPPGNWRASFNPSENPRENIDRILPERIVSSVSKLLNIEIPLFQTLRVGQEVRLHILESIPNAIVPNSFLQNHPLTIRFDKGGSETLVYEQLKQRKCVVATDKPLNINALQALRANIEGIVYLITKNDEPKFAEALHRHGIPYKLVTFLPREEWQQKKLSYSELRLAEHKQWPTRDSLEFLGELSSETYFKSNKRILSNGCIYLSYEHEKIGKKLDSFTQDVDTILDTPDFWADAESYHIYNYV